MYTIFENNGTLDERAITVMGMNAKETDSAIGYFGTGLKYAIAVVLRHSGQIILQPGDGSAYTIKAKHTDFRGKNFIIPTYRGNDLPFTTEYGKNWELWQAYRELRTNAMDEGGHTYCDTIMPKPQHGVVRILADNLAAIHNESAKYFFDEHQPDSVIKMSENVYRSEEFAGSVYYRGLLVGQLEQPHDFSYNILKDVQISEDRMLTPRGAIDIVYFIAAAVETLKDPELLEFYLKPKPDTFEAGLYIDYNEEAPEQEVFNKKALEIYEADPIYLHRRVRGAIDRVKRSKQTFRQLDMSDREKEMRDRVITTMARLGWTLEPYQVVWKADLGDQALGIVHNGTIYIGSRAFQEGDRNLLATTIEEYIHKRFGYPDRSREMQDMLLRQLTSVICDRTTTIADLGVPF